MLCELFRNTMISGGAMCTLVAMLKCFKLTNCTIATAHGEISLCTNSKLHTVLDRFLMRQHASVCFACLKNGSVLSVAYKSSAGCCALVVPHLRRNIKCVGLNPHMVADLLGNTGTYFPVAAVVFGVAVGCTQ